MDAYFWIGICWRIHPPIHSVRPGRQQSPVVIVMTEVRMPPMSVVHVEDERPLRDILGIAFRAAEPGINLHQFTSGDEALGYIEANGLDIDLFVLDIRLPGTMNGVQIAQKVRDLHLPGYIVLTSAYQAPDHDLLSALHSEYYPKPWHLFELTEKLLKYRMSKSAAQEPTVTPTSSVQTAPTTRSAPTDAPVPTTPAPAKPIAPSATPPPAPTILSTSNAPTAPIPVVRIVPPTPPTPKVPDMPDAPKTPPADPTAAKPGNEPPKL
jgi:CheY-like chemotaxis protein